MDVEIAAPDQPARVGRYAPPDLRNLKDRAQRDHLWIHGAMTEALQRAGQRSADGVLGPPLPVGGFAPGVGGGADGEIGWSALCRQTRHVGSKQQHDQDRGIGQQSLCNVLHGDPCNRIAGLGVPHASLQSLRAALRPPFIHAMTSSGSKRTK